MNNLAKRTLRVIVTQPFMVPVKRTFLQLMRSGFDMDLIPRNGAETRSPISDLVEKIYAERDMLLTQSEAKQVFRTARSVAHIRGDIAEVGVYRAASSKIIREAEPEKTFHLFDTFEGLPKSQKEDERFYEGLYKSSLADVQQYLSSYRNLHFYKGLFPDTAGPVKDLTFSFVHLDVDLYESTFNALEFFWPRMTAGGVILSHDYSTVAGVKEAFDTFFSSKNVAVIALEDSQCLVVR
jgi:hypothetical protein